MGTCRAGLEVEGGWGAGGIEQRNRVKSEARHPHFGGTEHHP